MRMRQGAALFALIALCNWAPAAAAPFAIQLGLDRLALDTPPGFTDAATFSSPRLTEFAETHMVASNRILVFGITDLDARRFSVGDALELRRYLLAGTPRATERNRIGPGEFAALAQEAVRELGAPPAAQPEDDFMRYLREKSAGQVVLLEVLKREPEIVSLLQGIMLQRPEGRDSDPPVFRLLTASLVLVGGKPLYVSVFSGYDGPADLIWIRALSARWIEDLRRLNRQ